MGAGRKLLSKARPALAAMLCLLLTCACDASSAAYDPAPWLADYALLKKGLQTSYANLAWFGSPQGGVDLPDLDRRTTAALASARSDKDAKAALTAFVRAIPDAHLQLLDPRTAAELSAQDGPDHNLLSHLFGGGACDDDDMTGGSKRGFSLPFDRAGARMIPQGGAPFASGLYDLPGGPRVGLVRIPSFEMRQYPDLCRGAATELKLGRAPAGVDLSSLVLGGFMTFLVQTLQDLQQRGATAVILDVGDNPGGSDSGQISAGLFAAAPLYSHPIWMVAGEPAANMFDHQLTVLAAAADHTRTEPDAQRDLGAAIQAVQARKASIPARACDMSWVWRERRPWTPSGCSNLVEAGYMSGPIQRADWRAYADRTTAAALYAPAYLGKTQGTWRGPVYVVTDETTASAAELFSAILQDNRAGKLVGRRTIGAGCGNQGPYRFVTLPRMRASLRVSDCVVIRADGSDEVAGVTPDIPVEGTDPVARARETLERISEDLRKNAPAAAPARDTTPASR